VLNRGIRTFNKDEFKLIYNGFDLSKITDRLLWAILKAAKKELHPSLDLNIEIE
jgi:hypothetical protein